MLSRLPPLVRTVGAFAVFLLPLTGCGRPLVMPEHFEPPVLTVGASMVDSISPRTLVMQLVLNVRNPNAFALSARVVDYRLRIGGHVLATGRTPSGVTVPAHASSTVDVRMQLSFPALSAAAPDALMLGEIPYDLDGTLRVGSWLATREVPFATASVLCISPPLELAGPPRLPSAQTAVTATLTSEAYWRPA